MNTADLDRIWSLDLPAAALRAWAMDAAASIMDDEPMMTTTEYKATVLPALIEEADEYGTIICKGCKVQGHVARINLNGIEILHLPYIKQTTGSKVPARFLMQGCAACNRRAPDNSATALPCGTGCGGPGVCA